MPKANEPEEGVVEKRNRKILSVILVGAGIMLIGGLMIGFFLDHYGRDFILNPEPIPQELVTSAEEADVSEIPTLPPGVMSLPEPVEKPLRSTKTCYSLAGDFTEEIRRRAEEVGCKYVELLL